ncbi:Rad51 family protein [Acanthocheilonema viteae]
MNNDDPEYSEETGLDLFLRLGAPWLMQKTGYPDIDTYLNGGVARGRLTEFVGNVASGKTQLCLSLIANQLVDDEKEQNKIVYIDTNGSFGSSRLLQMMKSRGVQDENIAKRMLKRVFIARAYDEKDLRVVLSNIQSIQNLVLIVIDSIGAALAFTAWEYFEGGRRVQDEIIAMLHYIARRYGCAIVTTNHFVYWRGKPSPSLGKRWIKAVDFRYLLWKLSNSNYYMQMISPQCHKVINDKVFYKISNKGIDSLTDVVQTQDMEALITQNWNTLRQIYDIPYMNGGVGRDRLSGFVSNVTLGKQVKATASNIQIKYCLSRRITLVKHSSGRKFESFFNNYRKNISQTFQRKIDAKPTC